LISWTAGSEVDSARTIAGWKGEDNGVNPPQWRLAAKASETRNRNPKSAITARKQT
jgi:hypothetical protein